MLERLSARVIAMIVAGVLVLLIVFAGPAACQKIRSLKAQARMDQAQQAGRVGAEQETMNTIGNNAGKAEQTDRTVKEGSNDIRKAPGADAQVDPRSRDAARRAACRMRAYRGSDECRALLGADPS